MDINSRLFALPLLLSLCVGPRATVKRVHEMLDKKLWTGWGSFLQYFHHLEKDQRFQCISFPNLLIIIPIPGNKSLADILKIFGYINWVATQANFNYRATTVLNDFLGAGSYHRGSLEYFSCPEGRVSVGFQGSPSCQGLMNFRVSLSSPSISKLERFYITSNFRNFAGINLIKPQTCKSEQKRRKIPYSTKYSFLKTIPWLVSLQILVIIIAYYFGKLLCYFYGKQNLYYGLSCCKSFICADSVWICFFSWKFWQQCPIRCVHDRF